VLFQKLQKRNTTSILEISISILDYECLILPETSYILKKCPKNNKKYAQKEVPGVTFRPHQNLGFLGLTLKHGAVCTGPSLGKTESCF
jgi:hypothetical protein